MWQKKTSSVPIIVKPEELETNVIVRYPEDQRAAMREWYGNLITMMSEEAHIYKIFGNVSLFQLLSYLIHNVIS